MRDFHLPVSIGKVKLKAREVSVREKPDFKASNGWTRKFFKRNQFTLHAKTSLSQYLLKDLVQRLSCFITLTMTANVPPFIIFKGKHKQARRYISKHDKPYIILMELLSKCKRRCGWMRSSWRYISRRYRSGASTWLLRKWA